MDHVTNGSAKNTPTAEKVICPCCGAAVPNVKFCMECGSPLGGNQAPQPKPDNAKNSSIPAFTGFAMNGMNSNPNPLIIQPNPAPAEQEDVEDDTGLTLLVDYCRKTLATVGGDGYDEIVLYKNEATGLCSLHTYSKYVYMDKEAHHSYPAKEGVEEAAFQLIKDLKLEEYKGKSGIGLCGGEYVVKFKSEDELIRISTSNMGLDGASVLCSVGNLLHAYIVQKDATGAQKAGRLE